MRSHPPTKAFVQRQRDKGRSTPEILRILKRAIAREMFKQLTRPHEGLGVQDLRPARQAKNITLNAAAERSAWTPRRSAAPNEESSSRRRSSTDTGSGYGPLDINRSFSRAVSCPLDDRGGSAAALGPPTSCRTTATHFGAFFSSVQPSDWRGSSVGRAGYSRVAQRRGNGAPLATANGHHIEQPCGQSNQTLRHRHLGSQSKSA